MTPKRRVATLLFIVLSGVVVGAAQPATFWYALRFFPGYELGFAAAKGDTVGIRHALASGANVNERRGYANRTALMTAALHGQTEAARFLVTSGANINAVDDTGCTARYLAGKARHPETVRVLTGRF